MINEGFSWCALFQLVVGALLVRYNRDIAEWLDGIFWKGGETDE